jgi:hypothetical protein
VELGRISGEVELTQAEASQIFGFDVESRLYDIRHKNLHYKFSIERLDILIENIKSIFGEKANRCYGLIQKYKNLNLDLKEYPFQQHNVGKPHYFRKVFPGDFEKAYLLGFLGHDGYLTSIGRIGLNINPKDIIIINKLVKAIDLDLSKVKITPETQLKIYNGERKEYQSIRIRFGCKPMYEDLKNNFIGSKDKYKEIPEQIRDLIEEAKLEHYELWYETTAGLTVFSWLLGFYDADGSYLGFNYGVLYSSNNKYLTKIREVFDIKSEVDTYVEPGTVVEIFDRECISKGMYGLRISSHDVFIKMINSYKDSLQRKRP